MPQPDGDFNKREFLYMHLCLERDFNEGGIVFKNSMDPL